MAAPSNAWHAHLMQTYRSSNVPFAEAMKLASATYRSKETKEFASTNQSKIVVYPALTGNASPGSLPILPTQRILPKQRINPFAKSTGYDLSAETANVRTLSKKRKKKEKKGKKK